MCSTWLNFRIKTLHFRIKYNLINVIIKIKKKKKKQQQQCQKKKNFSLLMEKKKKVVIKY